MDKLEGVRRDLHMQIGKGNVKIKKGMGSMTRVIILTVITILLLILGILLFSQSRERSRSERKKEEFLQEQGITTQQEVTDQ